MPIQLADLMRNQRTVTVDFHGETLDVTYRPGAMTPDLGSRAAADRNAPIALILSELVSRWDLYEQDAEGNQIRVPLTYERLRLLPTQFLVAVQRAINADSYGTEETSKNSGATSGAGSRPEGNSEKPRSFTR